MSEDSLLEDDIISVIPEKSIKRKKKVKKVILALLAFNVLLLLIIWPIAPVYFILPNIGKFLYLLLSFGQPVFLALVAFLFAAMLTLTSGTNQFKTRVGRAFRTIYASFMVTLLVALIFLGGITSSMDRNPFDLILYKDVKGTDKNTAEIRTGTFYAYNVIYIRRDKTQSEHHPNDNVILYNIDWLSNNEYQIYRSDQKPLSFGNDTVRIKIIDFNDEYIEYCGGYSEYGTYAKMYRK
jgi:hypothetical protein